MARQPVPEDDSQKRIERLEEQVRQLTSLVESLVEEDEDEEARPRRPDGEIRPTVAAGVRENVGRALGGVEGEDLESQIGGIWLPRILAVLIVTVVVLGGAMTLADDTFSPLHKIALGYGLSLIGIGYGVTRARHQNLFAHAMLGCGLAVAYFTTYACFFLESTRAFDSPEIGVAVLAGVLLVLAVICHITRSQTALGISLFLIYYTVLLSLREGVTVEKVYYSLGTSAVVSLVALVFHLTHRWMLFTWGALIAAHLTYLGFFITQPPELDLAPSQYFWLSNGFLTLIFVVFSLACITDAQRTGEYRKTVAPMAGANSFVFLTATWFSIRTHYPEHEWAFRLGIAGALAFFALYAAMVGQRRNYLFQIYAAKSVVVFTLALQAYLSHEWLLVAMALECIGLGLSYRRSGTVMFKVMGLGLMTITFVSTLLAVRISGEVEIASWIVPANWFSAVGVTAVFAIAACFYEKVVKPVTDGDRVVGSQWFLANTFLDLSGSAAALLHSAAAALVILSISIIDLGDDPALPYILAGEALTFVVVGFLLRTPQLEVASVLLLAASHVCYHVFLQIDRPGFEEQSALVLYTLLIAALTFLGGHLWERYLERMDGVHTWEHKALASIPHLAGAVMVITLADRILSPTQTPLAYGALGVLLLLGCVLVNSFGLRIAALLAVGAGVTTFYRNLYAPGNSSAADPRFLAYFVGFIIMVVACERLLVTGRRANVGGSPRMRTAFVALAVLSSLLGLYEWSDPALLTLDWLAAAVAAWLFGLAAREYRYRWAAMAMYFAAIVRAYFHDLPYLTPLERIRSFAALCVPMFVIAWLYSQYRSRRLGANNDTNSNVRGGE